MGPSPPSAPPASPLCCKNDSVPPASPQVLLVQAGADPSGRTGGMVGHHPAGLSHRGGAVARVYACAWWRLASLSSLSSVLPSNHTCAATLIPPSLPGFPRPPA